MPTLYCWTLIFWIGQDLLKNEISKDLGYQGSIVPWNGGLFFQNIFHDIHSILYAVFMLEIPSLMEYIGFKNIHVDSSDIMEWNKHDFECQDKQFNSCNLNLIDFLWIYIIN